VGGLLAAARADLEALSAEIAALKQHGAVRVRVCVGGRASKARGGGTR
jgi:hypothetical protein